MGVPTTGDVIAIGVLFDVLAVAALAVRIFNNRKHQKSIEIDDWLILPAFVLTITAGVACIVGGSGGFIGGHSLPMITPEQNAKIQKFQYSYWLGHVVIQGLIKLSILFFFRRFFRGHAMRTMFDIVNWTLITLIIMWTIAFVFADGFACGLTPEATWTSQWWTEDVCIDISAMMLACSASNWVFDVALLLLPMGMIFNLHLGLKRKLQLCAVFIISGFAVIAGLIRMIIWVGVYHRGVETVTLLGNTLSTADLQAVVTMAVVWTEVEIGVAFLVACLLPASKVLDKFSFSPLIVKLRSFGSSIRLGSKRWNPYGGSSGPENDVEAESESRKGSTAPLAQWDREMASVSRLASATNASGEHPYLGNHSAVTTGGPQMTEGAKVDHSFVVTSEDAREL